MLVDPRGSSVSVPTPAAAARPAARSAEDSAAPSAALAAPAGVIGALSALQVPELAASAIARMIADPESAIAAFATIDPDRTARLLAA